MGDASFMIDLSKVEKLDELLKLDSILESDRGVVELSSEDAMINDSINKDLIGYISIDTPWSYAKLKNGELEFSEDSGDRDKILCRISPELYGYKVYESRGLSDLYIYSIIINDSETLFNVSDHKLDIDELIL